VRYPERYIAELGGIENLLIPYDGGALPLRHFFDFSEERGVAEIASADGEQRFSVYGLLPPGSSDPERERLETEAARYLREQVELPAGYRLVVEDTRTEIRESISSLFIALAASVALIYLVLGFQFNSLRIPLVILATIPLGFIGVIASLALFGSTISLNSMLGTILLGGIVVNNAILLIDFYFQHRGRFTTTREALLYAAQLRFAPILITMSTTVLGMIPIALALTEGTGILQPLGVAVSGGLLVSTIFTLFMIPALLTLIHPEQVTENDEVKGSA
jgi:HAE1 family hydrophobic/amphiphilic exporter-1